MINNTSVPLAERLRPQNLSDYLGQEKIIGPDGPIYRMIQSQRLASLILWGNPGIGKTTLAFLLAQEMNRPFFTLSAIHSGVKDVRAVIEKAEKQDIFSSGKNPILFIDEIHRFSKSQQDSLLAAVEKGTITLIGATTENPSFEVIPALLSRCQVYTLEPLTADLLKQLANDALKNDEYLSKTTIEIKEYEALIRSSGGDARKLLNTLEIVAMAAEEKGENQLTNDLVNHLITSNPSKYDKSGEMHYDIISAFIKSIRGSDPNGAVYWLARMIEGGEDPKFIARRLLISASEDIGNANPTALVIANNCFSAVQNIGYPECRIVLAQATIYLATSAKSNASYAAIGKAQSTVKSTGDLAVPLHLRNAPTKLMKELGYGSNYNYSHDNPNNFKAQEYLPDELSGTDFYTPGSNPKEQQFKQHLKNLWGDKYKL